MTFEQNYEQFTDRNISDPYPTHQALTLSPAKH